jgi:hypothetical protein
MHRNIQPGAGLQVVQGGTDLGDRLVTAVESRTQDNDNADGVLIALRHRFGRRQVEAVALPVVHSDNGVSQSS